MVASSLASAYDATLKKHMKVHAAWSPVTSPYQVGDYGRFEGGPINGLFVKHGNIYSEFEIARNVETKSGSGWSFISEKTTTTRLEADANGKMQKVDYYSNNDVDGHLELQFTNSNSFYIKTDNLTVTRMTDAKKVAEQLRDLRGDGWYKANLVIMEVQCASSPVIVGVSEGGSDGKVTFSAPVKKLKAVESGRLDADVAFSSTSGASFSVNGGETGPVGLKIFQVGPAGAVVMK